MRIPKEKTYTITIESYALLLNICQRYSMNLAWKYPHSCKFCKKTLNLNKEILDTALKYEIPNLFRRDGNIAVPEAMFNIFEDKEEQDEYDQYALIDYIEYIAYNCKDYEFIYNDDCGHQYYWFKSSSNRAYRNFQKEINDVFDMVGLLYVLNDEKQIERIVEYTPLTQEIENNISQIKEDETRKLLQEAIRIYKSPYPDAPRDATEKIWDAFERLKTYYTNLDKKHSADKIVNNMSNGQQPFIELFDKEFKELREIGNKYRIRHHETDQIDITDLRHYDYFFNRCLSLIALAIQYLE